MSRADSGKRIVGGSRNRCLCGGGPVIDARGAQRQNSDIDPMLIHDSQSLVEIEERLPVPGISGVSVPKQRLTRRSGNRAQSMQAGQLAEISAIDKMCMHVNLHDWLLPGSSHR